MRRSLLCAAPALLSIGLAAAACNDAPPPNAPTTPAPVAVAPAPVASVAPSPTPAPTPPAPASSADFARLMDDYLDAEFRFAPTSATASGVHTYDDRIEDLSRASYERRIAELKAFKKRLDDLRASGAPLNDDDDIDATELDASLQAELFDLETLHTWDHNPMQYAQQPGTAIDAIIKRDFAPAKDRLTRVVARLRGVPAILDAARKNVQNPAREFTDIAIRVASGSVGFLDADVRAWAKGAASGDAALLADFDAADKAAVASLKGFVAWLKTDLLPRSKGSYSIGADALATKLRLEEMIDTPLPELLATGEAQLAKDRQALVDLGHQIDPKKSTAEVIKTLESDHPKADDLIASVRGSVEAARQFLVDHHIVTIPSEVRPRVEETPAYARVGTFASMDTPGPFETKATEAFYYVTPVEKDWDAKHKEEHLRQYSRPVVSVIDVHEVWPGHYLQFLYAPRFPTKARKVFGAGSNVEGWAHYTEQMMVEEGYGGDTPTIKLAQLSEALVRDCRYVVGIKLHTEGWTVAQGQKLFVDRCFLEPANAFEEARRGTYNPTYLYYTWGKLAIYKLRDEWRAKTGGSLQQFHDAFVAEGALPIPLVRRILLRKAGAAAHP